MWHFGSGKNNKLLFHIRNGLSVLEPFPQYRQRLPETLAAAEKRPDFAEIVERVDYCNKLRRMTPLGDGASRIGDLSLARTKSFYYWDCRKYLRWFPREKKWNFLFGDIIHVPEHPTILKSRPLAGDNSDSILLKLDSLRHFINLSDTIPFAKKRDMAIFRGAVWDTQKNRRLMMEKCFGSPLCDAGIVNWEKTAFPKEWATPEISLWEHLDYKFILAPEGNDVASNLKWIMSTNSLAVMPRPTCESWYLEGRLIPEKHYIEVADDYSDLEEKLRYYIANPEKAEIIGKNAREYRSQFNDEEKETLVSLLVLDKYFRLTTDSAAEST